MAKIVNAEIVRRPRARKGLARATIERMVRERVDEIMSQRDGDMLEADFSTKAIGTETMRRLNMWERIKWARYFAHWGCRQCKKKSRIHEGHGYCSKCYQRIRIRLSFLKKTWDAEHPQHPTEQLDAIDETIRQAKRVFESENNPEKES